MQRRICLSVKAPSMCSRVLLRPALTFTFPQRSRIKHLFHPEASTTCLCASKSPLPTRNFSGLSRNCNTADRNLPLVTQRLLTSTAGMNSAPGDRITVAGPQAPFAAREASEKVHESVSSGSSPEAESLMPIRDLTSVEHLMNGRFRQSFTLDAAFAGIVIGKGGQSVKSIQLESGASVALQGLLTHTRKSNEPCTVEIEGASQESVGRAKSMIESAVDKAVESRLLDYSHFVSLPLANHPDLVGHFTRFRDTILQQAGTPLGTSGRGEGDSERPAESAAQEDQAARALEAGREGLECQWGAEERSKKQRREHEGVDPSIFIKAHHLHLTVQMLKLWNPARVEAARKALEACAPALSEALERRPLRVQVTGLHLLKGNPTSAHVLYADVTEEDGTQTRLLKACEVLRQSMRDAGLVIRGDLTQPLKLHLTLINSSHRKGNRAKRQSKRMPFNASSIIQQYGGLNWGMHLVSEAHLSQRFCFDESGYYHCCGIVKL